MQSKIDSIKEQSFRVVINYILSSLSYALIFPGSSFWMNWLRGLYFVGLSFLTGYLLGAGLTMNECSVELIGACLFPMALLLVFIIAVALDDGNDQK